MTTSLDVTSLAIFVKSDGIQQAATSLEALSVAATKVEGKAQTIKDATSGLSSSQANAVASIEKLIAKFQQQADLMGANTSQMNAYQVAMKNGTELEQAMAAMLGAEVDAYKAKGIAQQEAIKDNQALDASYRKLQADADAYYAAQARAQAAGNALNAAGVQANEYKKLSDAQAEALKMNNALNAAAERQKAIQQNRDVELQATSYKMLAAAQAEAIKMNDALTASQARQTTIQQARDTEMHTMSVRAYAAAQAEAIRMNNAMDAAARKAAAANLVNNISMDDARAAARGLAGSLGALWTTYGSFAGMAVGIGIGASLMGVVKVGKDVENTLEGIRVRGQESVDSIDKMRESIQNLGQGVYGPKEVANAFDVLILAGLRADQALIGIKDALNLATVGGTSIEKAATVLVQVSTALGYTAEGFGRISDVIAKTAAVSISSVDGISESFKSASVVGKLYGQSLVDLGTQFAILSNLGIKNTQAGTSSKNFFSDLASGTAKVTKGLDMLNLTIQDLQDKQGNFKSFNEVLRTLAGDGEKGFNSLTAASQKYVQTLITNERGNKLMTEGLDLIRQKGTETATALDDISKQINESWGFTAQGAAAMALTVDAQFKSVKNTLQTQLGTAFVEIQPQLSLVARSLKEAFASPEFLSGVQALAVGVANFSVFVVQNADAFWQVTRAILAFKAASMILGILTGIAGAFTTLKTAMDLAKISAIGFQAALGLLGVALAAGASLLVWWTTKRDEALGDKQKAAINYMDDFKSKLDEENKRLESQIDLMNRGRTATDAFTESQQRLQLQKVKEQGQNAINDAQQNLNKTYSGLTDYQKAGVANYQKGVMPQSGDGAQITGIQAMQAATQKLLSVKLAVKKAEDDTQASLDKNIALSKQAADLATKQAQARGVIPQGTGVIPPKADKAAEADAYQKELQSYQNQITAAKKQLDQEKANAQSAYNQGLIGERGLIESNYAAEVTAANNSKKFIQEKIDAAQGADNKLAAIEKYKGDMATQNSAIDAAESTRKNKYAELEVSQQQQIQRAIQNKYVAEGNFSAAYEEEFKRKHDTQVKGLMADIANEKDATVKLRTEKFLSAIQDEYAAGKEAADNKTAMASFMELANSTKNALKGVQTETEGMGLSVMLDAASAASKTLADNMGDLSSRMGKLTNQKDINEAQAQLTNLAETQRKLWVGVGQSISTSLGNAFGSAGKAAGDMLMVAINTGNVESKLAADKATALAETEAAYKHFGFNQLDTAQALDKVNEDYAKKEAGTRLKAYGDMAGAAKGFFTQGTTGYKVMETAEKAFRLIELAGMAKSLAATIATATAKAAAWIPAVFMSFMGSLGPWGMAAAGIAIASVLGSAFSGGGSAPDSSATRQATQGTGTVLGMPNDKSASIANSLTILAKDSGLGLAHDNTMIGYLKTVADNISSFASLIVRTTGLTGTAAGNTKGLGTTLGGAIGTYGLGPFSVVLDKLTGGWLSKISGSVFNSVFGGKVTALDTGFTTNRTSLGSVMSSGISASQYTDLKKDGGLFSSNKYSTQMTSLGADANAQFTQVITGMANSITAAAKVMGVDGPSFTQHLQTFVVDLGKISTKGLTGDQIQSEIEAAFSKMGDDMAKFAIIGLDQFTKVGEGYLETLMRVTNDLIQVKDVFAVLGKSFTLTGTAAVTVSENLITAAGSLDALTSGTQYFVDNFLTEAQKMGPITDSVNQQMAALGLSGITTQDAFTKLVRSLDLTDPASQQLYVQLLALAPSFKAATDYAQQLADGTVTLTAAQQKALDAVTKAKTALQDSYNAESSALQSTIDKTNSFITTLKSYQESLKLGADSPLTNMQKYAEAKKQFEDTVAAAQGGDQAAMAQFTTVSSALLAASKVVNASGDAYTNDFNMVQQMSDSLVNSSTSQVDVATASLDALNKQVQGLLDINASVLSVTQAITDLQQAITLGGAAGLSNTQMGTTYTPTATQVTAATPTQSTANGTMTGGGGSSWFGDAIQGLTDQVAGLRQDQSAQTGAIVSATVDSNAANADDTVAGLGMLGTLITSVQKKVTLV